MIASPSTSLASGARLRARGPLGVMLLALLAGCAGDKAGASDTSASADGGGVDSSDPYGTACFDGFIGGAVGVAVAQGSVDPALNRYDGGCTGERSTGGDVLISWVPRETQTYSVDTRGTEYDSLLQIHDGDCSVEPIGCAYQDVDGENWSEVLLDVEAGQRMTIVIDGANPDATGLYQLNINPR